MTEESKDQNLIYIKLLKFHILLKFEQNERMIFKIP